MNVTYNNKSSGNRITATHGNRLQKQEHGDSQSRLVPKGRRAGRARKKTYKSVSGLVEIGRRLTGREIDDCNEADNRDVVLDFFMEFLVREGI